MRFLTIISFFVIILFPSFVDAHRSGCHRLHSCPSDSGSYTCGDTGYCSKCPNNQYCENGQPKLSSNSSDLNELLVAVKQDQATKTTLPPEILWLQKEPLTLLDLGIFKANNTMESMPQAVKDWSLFTKSPKGDIYNEGWVKYYPEENIIILNASVAVEKKNIKIADYCKVVIESIRKTIYHETGAYPMETPLIPDGEKYSAKGAEEIMKDWFSQEGFENKSRPKTLEKQLVQITELQVSILHFVKDFTPPNVKNCSMPLAGGKITIK